MIALSHSSIQTYLDCPQKWKFKYVDKIPEKPRHFFSFGKSVHTALEFFYNVPALPAPELDAVLEHYRDNWISEGYSSPAQEAEYKADGEKIVRDYYKKHIGSFQVPYFTEYGFQLDVDGVTVRGFVDRVDKVGEDRISIIDYKTGKGIALSRVEQDAQLTMYQMACEQLLEKKVESLTFYHLPSQKALTVAPHGKSQVKALRERIVSTAKLISDEIFDPKPEERKCSWCDFKPLCPVFKSADPAPRAAAGAVARDDEELARLVDRYGALLQELEEVKAAVIEALREKGYARVFGRDYEASVSAEERWEFPDRKKVLDAIQSAGLWERILAPSAPLVQKLMKDPALAPDLRRRLERLGEKVTQSELRVKRVEAQTVQ